MSAHGFETECAPGIVAPAVLHAAPALRAAYAVAEPFPHVVIDDFLRSDVAAFVGANFPTMEQMPTVFKEPMSYKGQLSDIAGKWPAFVAIFDELQSAPFRDFISTVTGIEQLRADPVLAGGGLHQSPRSGFLDIHVDANFHPHDKAMHRRVNILIYVSPAWEDAWGGQLEFWRDGNNSPVELVQKVTPRFNRAVIFSTTRTSWHGVGPVHCPDGSARRSMALYYYTATRPEQELYRDSSVIWMNRSVAWKRAVYPVMNAGIAVLKPYAKQVRALLGRDKVFDAAQKRDP